MEKGAIALPHLSEGDDSPVAGFSCRKANHLLEITGKLVTFEAFLPNRSNIHLKQYVITIGQ